jgi:lipopolysaccharide export system protein LptA
MTASVPARAHLGAALLLAAAVAAAAPAAAAERKSGSGTLPEAYQGLGVSSDEPIQFEAESLEVREQESLAVFSGNVVVRQNETVLKTDKLVVYYVGEGKGQGAQQVRKLEATGKVLVTSGPQTASGDAAVFDTAANTIVVSGNVVLTQGDNVIRGPRLVINIDSGQARMEGGRVQMLIEPKSLQNQSGG